uniref:Uncharacterized protein n=1 Tax=Brassica campestris TaxID=3711 RepID=A0A3P6CGM1_BRACM|nr:unnamed protein product [Brassica rapa]
MIWVRCTSYTSSLLFSFMQFDGCGEADSYFSNLLNFFPTIISPHTLLSICFFFLNLISLVDDNQQSVWPFYLGLFGLESACIKSL